jgi:YVTN family beta-propeller protein
MISNKALKGNGAKSGQWSGKGILGVPLILGLLVYGISSFPPTIVAKAAGVGAYTVYVANTGSNSVTPIDTSTNLPAAAITLGSGYGPRPIAITPNGSTAYVANLTTTTEGQVTPINTTTNTPGTPIAAGYPLAIAITPDGKTAYTANESSYTVTPINLSTGISGNAINVGWGPDAIAITPDGKTAYVADLSNPGTVTPINTATNLPGFPITVGIQPDAIAITPDGKTAYVANQAGTVTPIDISTNIPGSAISVGSVPYGIAITPDGKTAYVTNHDVNLVTPIDLSTNTTESAISVVQPYAIAISPDGKTAYVSNYGVNTVTPINLSNDSPGTPIMVGSLPSGIAITPDQAPVAAFSVTPAATGSPTAFDASASSVESGTITSYAWSFGDSTSVTTTTPTTTHTYTSTGNYTATVTETDSAGTSTTQVFTGQTMSLNGGASAVVSHTFYVPKGIPPTISSVTPAAGPVTGNQKVTVEGTGFMAGMMATLGGASVTPTGITSTTFSFITPAAASGYAQVQVATSQGTSGSSPNDGYIYSALSAYFPLTPFRILDTRTSTCTQCGGGALTPGATRTVQISGVTGLKVGVDPVPAGATAVVLNVTAIASTGSSLLTVYPNGTGRPLASNLNFTPGQVIANLVIVALGQSNASDTQREVNLYNAVGTVNVVADVEGYFAPQVSSNPAGEFHSMAPLRVCDTRVGLGITLNGCNQGHSSSNLLGSEQVVKVNVTGKPVGVGGSQVTIPSDGTAGSVVLNLTAIAPTASTYVSVYPPQADGNCTVGNGSSNLNVLPGKVQSNRVMVPVGPAISGGHGTDVCVFNAAGNVNFILDASGWFGSSSGSAPVGTQFQAIGPTRVCDTRSGNATPCSGHAIGSGGTLTIAVTGVSGIPSSGPAAIIGNLTAIAGTASTYLLAYPADVSPRPNGSDLNPLPGSVLPNLVAVGLSQAAPSGQVKLFNALGTINAVLDVDGWFQ